MYEDGRPGEVFIKMSKEGSTLSGVMDGLALTLSIGLQYGVPLKVLVDKLLNTRFEPSGITANPNIRFATSVLDYIARWLGGRFISADYLKLAGAAPAEGTTVAGTFARERRRADLGRAARERAGEQFSTRRARGRADMLGMRHADGAERGLLQVRELRKHERVQLMRETAKEETP